MAAMKTGATVQVVTKAKLTDSEQLNPIRERTKLKSSLEKKIVKKECKCSAISVPMRFCLPITVN